MNDNSSGYDTFAWIYNRYWGMRFTPGAIAVLDELVIPGLHPGAAILDLCCGSGNLAGILSDRGYSVTGIDSSEAMLDYARQNAPGVLFIQADARSFSMPSSFNLVTSFFDSLNHILTLEELTKVFYNTFSCLRDNGLFLFDMNTEHGFTSGWQGYYGIIEDDHACLFPQSYDPESRIARFNATMFKLEDNAWYRSETALIQKCYSESEIRQALTDTGLVIEDVFAWSIQAGREELTETADRMYFLCRK